MSLEDLTKFNEALNQYYILKSKYESTKKKEVTKLLKNDTLTKKAKQDKFKQMKKKCVICGKEGGTIFKQEDNVLIAKCGSSMTPCRLDIRLQKAKYINITDLLTELNQNINTNKSDIICSKLNFLFGFINESTTIEAFNKFKAELILEVKKYKKMHELYLSIILNISNSPEIQQKTNDILNYKQTLNDLLKTFESTKDVALLKEAVELYLHNIKETAEKVQSLEYKTNMIEYHDDDNTSHLIQEIYTQHELQVPIDNMKNKILAFIK